MPLELGSATPEGPTPLPRARLPFMLTPAPTKDAKRATRIDSFFSLDRVLFFVPYFTAIPGSFAFRGAFAPEESQIGQGVDEFLIGHGGIRKHACPEMPIQNCTRGNQYVSGGLLSGLCGGAILRRATFQMTPDSRRTLVQAANFRR